MDVEDEVDSEVVQATSVMRVKDETSWQRWCARDYHMQKMTYRALEPIYDSHPVLRLGLDSLLDGRRVGSPKPKTD